MLIAHPVARSAAPSDSGLESSLIQQKLNQLDVVIGGTVAYQTKMQLLFCVRRGQSEFPKNFMIKKQQMATGGTGSGSGTGSAIIQLVPNMLSSKLPQSVRDANEVLPHVCVDQSNRQPFPFQYVLLNDLLPNTLYQFTVLATRSTKSGRASASVTNKTLETPPSKPPTLSASRVHSTRRDVQRYELRFTPPPEEAQHGAIRQYAVTVLDVRERVFNRSLFDAGADRHVIDVQPNRNLLVALSAINSAGASPNALVVIDANGQITAPGAAGASADPSNGQLYELLQMIESQSRNSDGGLSSDPDWILLDSDAKLAPADAEPPDEYDDEPAEEPVDGALVDQRSSSTAPGGSSITQQWWFVAGLALLVAFLWILCCVGFIVWYRTHCRPRARHDKPRNKSDVLLQTFRSNGV